MSNPTLGKRPVGNDRDAIHLAIIPAIAGECMTPGKKVMLKDGVARLSDTDAIGIVDPFLPEALVSGDRFWLCLFPNTVTGMRHHWSHPAFPDESIDRDAAEEWLREYARCMNTYDSDTEAFERLIEGLENKDLFAYGTDLHGLYELEEADELKRNAEIYLGKEIDWDDFEFSCSC